MKRIKHKGLVIAGAILACILVAAIVTATVLGIVTAKNTVVSLDGARVTRGMYAYWQAYARYRYLSLYASEGAEDTEAFFAKVKDPDTGLTYGEDLARETDLLVEKYLIAARLFDASGYEMTDAQRATLEGKLDTLISARFRGDTERLDTLAEKYGFDRRSIEQAYLFETKAALLSSHSSASAAQKEAFYRDTFRRARMIFVPLSEETTRTYIAGQIEGGLSDEGFDRLAADPAYNSDTAGLNTYTDGYYFSPDTKFTKSYAATYPSPLAAVFSLDEGKTATAETDTGTWFIRRLPLVNAAYTSNATAHAEFFSDFDTAAATYYLEKTLTESVGSAEWFPERKFVLAPQGKSLGADLKWFF